MNKLVNLTTSTLLSGGIINNGSLEGYISDSTRRALGMSLAQLQDGNVHYFSKDAQILKRAVIQTVSQTAYGLLRSYPRYLKYWEQKERDKYLKAQSQSSLANKQGQYFKLINEQQIVAQEKNYTDSIVGNIVADYLELSINPEGNFYNSKLQKIESNRKYGDIKFVDLQPQIQIGSRNNIVQTIVQGRDYSRKEFISGGGFRG